VKRGRQGDKLPEALKEAIRQMYAIEPNKAFIAREMGLHYSTVCRILNHEDPEVARERRREAMSKLAGTITDNAQNLAEDIGRVPEDATFMQKATAFGIQVDKLEKLDRRLDEQYKDDKFESGQPALPENVEQLAGMIRNDLKALSGLIGYKLDPGEDPAEAVKTLTEKIKVVEAEVTKVDDLYPEGKSDA
jgi:hypothetical protein